MWILLALAALLALAIGTVIYDVLQRRHAVLHNFPIIGHFRYWLEAVGPELRQYIVTSNDEEKPFSRDERRWIYASAKGQNNAFGFGSDNDFDHLANYVVMVPSAFPPKAPPAGRMGGPPDFLLPAAKVIGRHRKRPRAFRPESVVNISGMSFGALSSVAVRSMNKGAALARCLHNTGEGGVTPYHRDGAELIWQIGSGYFGCRTADGKFDLAQFLDVVAANPIRAIEIKLSQGAKPAYGGLVPAKKVTPEIARFRGVVAGEDCISPPSHSAFGDVDSMLDFAELLATETGLPVGIKSAVGELGFWQELARQMAETERGVDFITIDGGEGGTGAGPLTFIDHVGLPFKNAFSRVYRIFVEEGVQENVVFIGSGKLGFPAPAMLAFALGADMVNVGREAMLAIGCIQSQRCHTDRCPTGVTTHSKWRQAGVDPDDKAIRLAGYIVTLRRELLDLSRACGAVHPALVSCEQVEILDGRLHAEGACEIFGYAPEWGLPPRSQRDEITALMHSDE